MTSRPSFMQNLAAVSLLGFTAGQTLFPQQTLAANMNTAEHFADTSNADRLREYAQEARNKNDGTLNYSYRYNEDGIAITIGNFQVKATQHGTDMPVFEAIRKNDAGGVLSTQELDAPWKLRLLMEDLGLKVEFFHYVNRTENDYLISAYVHEDLFPGPKATMPFSNSKTGKHVFNLTVRQEGDKKVFYHSKWYGENDRKRIKDRLSESNVSEAAIQQTLVTLTNQVDQEINTRTSISKSLEKIGQDLKNKNTSIDYRTDIGADYVRLLFLHYSVAAIKSENGKVIFEVIQENSSGNSHLRETTYNARAFAQTLEKAGLLKGFLKEVEGSGNLDFIFHFISNNAYPGYKKSTVLNYGNKTKTVIATSTGYGDPIYYYHPDSDALLDLKGMKSFTYPFDFSKELSGLTSNLEQDMMSASQSMLRWIESWRRYKTPAEFDRLLHKQNGYFGDVTSLINLKGMTAQIRRVGKEAPIFEVIVHKIGVTPEKRETLTQQNFLEFLRKGGVAKSLLGVNAANSDPYIISPYVHEPEFPGAKATKEFGSEYRDIIVSESHPQFPGSIVTRLESRQGPRFRATVRKYDVHSIGSGKYIKTKTAYYHSGWYGEYTREGFLNKVKDHPHYDYIVESLDSLKFKAELIYERNRERRLRQQRDR